MYQLRATLYELPGRDRVQGELYSGEGESQVLVTSAHLDFVEGRLDGSGRHVEIMDHMRALCTELAQNIDLPLF